jgi:muramoyltetrapeptide carboxypeptidase
MTITRRTVLGAAAVAGGSTLVPGAAAQAAPRRVVRAPALRPGDLVRIVAPGSSPDARLARGVEILTGFGLQVELGAHVNDRYGYRTGWATSACRSWVDCGSATATGS